MPRPDNVAPDGGQMTLYDFSLIVGALGLATMGIGGVRHGHGASHGGRHHGAGHRGHAHSASPAHRSAGASALGGLRAGVAQAFWALTSPRVLFTLLVGFGAAGALAERHLTGPVVLAIALGGALVFELGVVGPIWRTLLRFGSQPALTLETALYDEARAASGFDTHGDGLVALEVDGQIVQLLGTLTPADQAAGCRVHAGDRVRIEAIDDRRNRCTVSYIGT